MYLRRAYWSLLQNQIEKFIPRDQWQKCLIGNNKRYNWVEYSIEQNYETSKYNYKQRGRLPSRPSRNAGVIQRGKMVLLLSGIFVVVSCILQRVDSLEDIRWGKDKGNLNSNSRKGIRVKRGVLSVNTVRGHLGWCLVSSESLIY